VTSLIPTTAVAAVLLLCSGAVQAQGRSPAVPLAAYSAATGMIGIEAEALLGSVIATHGRVGQQDMRPFGPDWTGDGQVFWAVAQPGAQLRLTFKTTVAGRYQVFLRFTRAPDYAFVRASFDGAPPRSFNGYAPKVRTDRALLAMVDLAPGLRELLVEVVRKDRKSSGWNVGLDRIELEPVHPRSGVIPGRIVPPTGPPAPGTTKQAVRKDVPTRRSTTSTTSQTVAPVGVAGPGIPRARLAFARFTPDGPDAVLGPSEQTVYRPHLTVTLAWTVAGAVSVPYRWQVLSQPLGREASPTMTPPGLLAEGQATIDHFRIPLGSFPPLGTGPLSEGGGLVQDDAGGPVVAGAAPSGASTGNSRTRGATGPVNATTSGRSTHRRSAGEARLPDSPRKFYIRIFPVVEGKPVGPASNVVIAHYFPGPDPVAQKMNEGIHDAMKEVAEREKRLAEMKEAAKVYQVSILGFQPMIFEDPNRWGCVYVISNPYAAQVGFHPLGGFAAGKEYCGAPYKGQGYQADDLWDVVSGWAKAYDILADFYDDAKSTIAAKLAQWAPCEELGKKLGGTCEDFVHEVSSGAMSAGLAAAGLPPTLPNLSELKGLAEAKVVEVAVDYTCKEFETQGGYCTPEMKAKLNEVYQQGIDKIQLGIVTVAKEPGCGDEKTAKEHGRHALPCFTKYPGADARPATGAVTEPATVTIRVTRVKPNPSFAMPACRLSADLSLTKHWDGGNLYGIDYKPAVLQGNPFLQPETDIPPLALGKSMEVTLVFSRYQPFAVPGHYNATMWWDDWLRLYRGGKGPLSAGVRTAVPVPGAKLFDGTEVALACADNATGTVQIPD
jgi:hypothetical protein